MECVSESRRVLNGQDSNDVHVTISAVSKPVQLENENQRKKLEHRLQEAVAHRASGYLHLADKQLERIVKEAENLLGTTSEYFIPFMKSLAELRHAQGRLIEAENGFSEAAKMSGNMELANEASVLQMLFYVQIETRQYDLAKKTLQTMAETGFNADDIENLHLRLAASRASMVQCSNCGWPSNLHKSCTGCRRVVYCNTKCQKVHWKFHKYTCRLKGGQGTARGVSKEIDS